MSYILDLLMLPIALGKRLVNYVTTTVKDLLDTRVQLGSALQELAAVRGELTIALQENIASDTRRDEAIANEKLAIDRAIEYADKADKAQVRIAELEEAIATDAQSDADFYELVKSILPIDLLVDEEPEAPIETVEPEVV
jgi:hypothetical protein